MALQNNIKVNCRLSFGSLSFKFVDSDIEWSLKISTRDSNERGISKYGRDDSCKWGAFVEFKEPLDLTNGRYQRCFGASTEFSKETARIIWDRLLELGFQPTKETAKIIFK